MNIGTLHSAFNGTAIASFFSGTCLEIHLWFFSGFTNQKPCGKDHHDGTLGTLAGSCNLLWAGVTPSSPLTASTAMALLPAGLPYPKLHQSKG